MGEGLSPEIYPLGKGRLIRGGYPSHTPFGKGTGGNNFARVPPGQAEDFADQSLIFWWQGFDLPAFFSGVEAVKSGVLIGLFFREHHRVR